jgi:hypothetical protein
MKGLKTRPPGRHRLEVPLRTLTTTGSRTPRPHQDTSRARRRRPLAAGTAALALTGAALVAGPVGPAHADNCDSVGLLPCVPDIPIIPDFTPFPPYGIPTMPPPDFPPIIIPGPSVPIQISVEVKAEIDALQALITRPACNSLVSGPAPAGGHDALWWFPNTDFQASLEPDRTEPRTVAETILPPDVPRPRIVVYPPFHDLSTYAQARSMFDNATYNPPPTAEQLRATYLLHEIGHVTGGQVHAPNDPNAAFNRAVLRQCFGLTPTAPAPARPRDPRPPRGPLP